MLELVRTSLVMFSPDSLSATTVDFANFFFACIYVKNLIGGALRVYVTEEKETGRSEKKEAST